MATIPLPALAIKQPENPLDTYAHIIGIRGMMLQQQGQQQQQQLLGSQLQDIDAGRGIMRELAASAQDSGQAPTPQDVYRVAGKYGASATATSAIANGLLTTQQHVSEIAKNDAATRASNLDTQIKTSDQNRGRLQSIIDGPEGEKQSNFAQMVADAEKSGLIKPGTISPVYPGDEAAQALADHWALGSVLAKEATEKMTAQGAQQRGQAAMGELTLNRQKFAQSPEELARRAATGDTEAQAILNQQNQQAINLAGAKAGAEAKAKFPYELSLKQQENANNPVFAVNPQTKQRELTTVGDAQKMGYTNPVKASQTDIEKETQLNAQMNELQLNTSRFKSALNAMGTLSKSDVAAMTHILSDPNVNNAILNTAGMPAVMSMIEQGGKASDWNSLSRTSRTHSWGHCE